jgi:hypothetical protein
MKSKFVDYLTVWNSHKIPIFLNKWFPNVLKKYEKKPMSYKAVVQETRSFMPVSINYYKVPIYYENKLSY